MHATIDLVKNARIGDILVYERNNNVKYRYLGDSQWEKTWDFNTHVVSTQYVVERLIVPHYYEYIRAAESLEDFKVRVREVAERAKKKHGWCDEIEAILEELGIPKIKRVFKIGDKIKHEDTDELPVGTMLKYANSYGTYLYVRQEKPTSFKHINNVTSSTRGKWTTEYEIVYLPEEN